MCRSLCLPPPSDVDKFQQTVWKIDHHTSGEGEGGGERGVDSNNLASPSEELIRFLPVHVKGIRRSLVWVT